MKLFIIGGLNFSKKRTSETVNTQLFHTLFYVCGNIVTKMLLAYMSLKLYVTFLYILFIFYRRYFKISVLKMAKLRHLHNFEN